MLYLYQIRYLLILLSPVFGSFISAYTWRLPRNISISKGRSQCPKCGKKIVWYDNIPLVSFLLLGGKCRSCGKKISFRYPLIELSALVISVILTFLLTEVGLAVFFVYYFVSLLFLTIAVIDIEHQVIPDRLVFASILVSFILVFFSSDIYVHLFSGFVLAMFLYGLHILTNGKGMGLGDVKLALPIGFVLGFPDAILALFYAFFVGAVVGILFIILGKSKLKTRIAFGPFMIIGFFLGIILQGVIFNGIWIF